MTSKTDMAIAMDWESLKTDTPEVEAEFNILTEKGIMTPTQAKAHLHLQEAGRDIGLNLPPKERGNG